MDTFNYWEFVLIVFYYLLIISNKIRHSINTNLSTMIFESAYNKVLDVFY